MKEEYDFQVTAFYKWENSCFRGKTVTKLNTLTPEQCTALVEDICRCYNVDVPHMKYPNGLSMYSTYVRHPGIPLINLYDWARNRAAVIHETAHHIHFRLGAGPFHGPEYVAIFAYLISEYMSIPLHEIRHKASLAGLKLAPTSPQFKERPNSAFVRQYC